MAGKNKVIVVTGATRGLGRAMVNGFVKAGHRVAGCGRNQEAVAELAKAHGEAHLFAIVDVTDDQAVAKWASEVVGKLGVPELLVNNAAVINRSARLWELEAEEFDPVIDVNIKGVANVLRAFVPRMVAKGKGVIVNFSSGWGRSTAPEVAPYCATKYAIEGLTLALAQELPPGVAAVPLNPGIIDTDMLRSSFGEGAGGYPGPMEWAERAVPYLLRLSARDNGRSLDIR